ncbi:transcriptional regulator [Dehalobacterium formicoaceticum]|uniref:Transcriptional regulator n=1 Tax=Dehalobacterium formicoaceticum TaxID=51515 RepID=A0ABT1Y7S9_9FIRM|nr:transcriptional regulator [Dehalobacterium formicoaceticum]MCR6545949.1 transcriptional regulator [Dehalobacterium formicoaceticum]
MIFGFGIRKKTVKELRKNRGYTAAELAQRLKINVTEILRIDNLRLKDIEEPLYSKILPILRGDEDDKIPW